MSICPLVFEPIYKPKIWGGRNIERLFGRALPPGASIGESWECADLEKGQSVVSRGPARGRALHSLVEAWGSDLYGRAPLANGRFPLVVKYLDAAADLSIQVHPAAEGNGVSPGETGPGPKYEAWYILESREGGSIYRGLREGVTVEQFGRVLHDRPRDAAACLNRIPVRAGDTYYVPGGTVHAIGAGVVAVEVQTPSDVTYRLYDWDRSRPDDDAGLHVDRGLACIRNDPDIQKAEARSHVTSLFTTVTRLVSCPSFIIERVRFTGEIEQDIPYAEPVCWIVLEGRGEIRYGGAGCESFSGGDVVLLPAALPKGRLRTLTDCIWLEVTVPVASDLGAYDRPDSAMLRAPDRSPDAPIPLNIDVRRPR